MLLKKPPGPQTVKKIPAFLELNVHYHIHNSPPICLNPVHASSYILILFYHLHLRLPSSLFPSGVHNITLRELLSTICSICSAYLIIFYLLIPIIFPEEYTHTRVGTLIVATIYLRLIQIRYTIRSFTVLHCSHQHSVQPVASDVEVV